MHAWVRRLVEKKSALAAVPGLAEAAETVRALDAELGGGLAWGIVDGPVAQAANAERVATLAADLPETKELFGGRTVRSAFLKMYLRSITFSRIVKSLISPSLQVTRLVAS